MKRQLEDEEGKIGDHERGQRKSLLPTSGQDGPIQPPALTSLAYTIDELEEPDYKYSVLKLLKDKNQSNRFMCELRMALFVAAVKDPNRDNCLHPFPHCFFDRRTKVKNYDGVAGQIENIPEFSKISEFIEVPAPTWELLNWVFTNPLSLEPLVSDIHDKIKELRVTTGLENLPIPNNVWLYMFNITHTQPKPKFSEAKKKYGSLFAFHGSSIRNFHSIIHRGLICSLNTRSAFGHGTYTSPNLSMANQYAQRGIGWLPSLFGTMMRCIAVVEVVMSPDTKNHTSFYVCDNDDHMQLSHLYVYRY